MGLAGIRPVSSAFGKPYVSEGWGSTFSAPARVPPNLSAPCASGGLGSLWLPVLLTASVLDCLFGMALLQNLPLVLRECGDEVRLRHTRPSGDGMGAGAIEQFSPR